MQIFARPELAANVPIDDDRPRLLLEGSWPLPKPRGRSNKDLALDDLCDGRDAAIDVEAERLAERIAVAVPRPTAGQPSFADVNILRLRYAAVKWLRPLAWRRGLSLAARPRQYELHVSAAADDAEYIALWRAIAAVDDCELQVVVSSSAVAPPAAAPLTNSRWRKMLARWSGNASQLAARADSQSRVLLCGNPRLLDPICREFVRRGISAAWIYDRYPIRAGLRWAWRGVPTFTCDDPSSPVVAPVPQLGDSIRYDRVDLTTVVRTWLDRHTAESGADQSRQLQCIDEHFAAFRPTHVIVDEDATPLKRILVAAAREQGVRSAVVQHGACAIRFGFAPLKADCILAADVGTQRQLLAWGVEPHRIFITGSPYRARFASDVLAVRRPATDSARKQILLIGTPPPRERRPDAVEYHFTARTHEQMLHAACAAVAEIPQAELVIRPHPRTATDVVLRQVLARFPQLRYRISSRRENLLQLVAAADCVLSCGSSVGIESALAGVPVVQLLPPGSGNILPAEWYGLIGTARTQAELLPLLQTALTSASKREPVSVPTAEAVVQRLVDVVLYPGETKPPHFATAKSHEVHRA